MSDLSVSNAGANTASLNYIQELLGKASMNEASGGFGTTALSGKNAYGASSYSSTTGSSSAAIGQAALKRALQEMEAADGEQRITLEKIQAYQKELEDTFSLGMRIDLLALGVPPETPFTLQMSSEGKISVAAEDPAAKQVIEQYLKDNPEMCEQFGYIQALANVNKANMSAIARGGNGLDAATTYQSQAISAFFSEELDSGNSMYTSLLAGFSGASEASEENVKFFTGLSVSA